LIGGQMLYLGFSLRTVLRYGGVSYQTARFGERLAARELSSFLQLPATGNPQARAYGRRLRERLGDNEAIARTLLQQINRDEFYYTLTPPVLAEDLIDDFWFNQRRGFCEHYAAATAFILRAADVPTRVIGGYQGGDYNPFGKYVTVSNAKAHAWLEYWHPLHGWRRLDPTAAILPTRIEPDLRQQLRSRDGIFEPAQWASTALGLNTADLLQTLHDSWQLADQWFDSHIVRFNRELQQDWLQQAGFSSVQRQDLIQLLVLAVFLGLALAAWLILRPGRVREPLLRCYQQFERYMRKRGVERAAGEPPLHFFARCQQQQAAASQTIATFARHYLAMRFGQAPVDINALRQLLRQLP
jgi:hypothetical protein